MQEFLKVDLTPTRREIEKLRDSRDFWRTWAIMFTIFFGLLFWYAVAHH